MTFIAPSRPRCDSLDIWRGVACLLVLIYHSVSYSGLDPLAEAGTLERAYAAAGAVAARLWLGVPIFFVISGYCIAAAADNHRRKQAPIKRYFFRRFHRIFPPYWAVLGVTALAIGAGDLLSGGAIVRNSGLLRPWWYSPAQWVGSITLTELWRPHVFGGQKALFLGHAWTLCYEEQFYAVCGALLLLCRRRFFLGAAAVSAAVAIAAVSAAYFPIPIDGFFLDGAWLQFALGILLYWALNYGGAKERWLAAGAFTVVVVWASSYGTALLETDKNRAQEFFVAGAFAFAALLLRPFDARLVAAGILRPLRTCGLMCYSLYLVHLPVIDLLRACLRAGGIETTRMSPLVSLIVYAPPAIWLSWQFHLRIERRFISAAVPAMPVQGTAIPAL